jgi:hypothetical protein
MLEPFKQFFCDTCGLVIESIKDGIIEYFDEPQSADGKPAETMGYHSFKIVHSKRCQNRGSQDNFSDESLEYVLSEGRALPFVYGLLDPGFTIEPVFKGGQTSDIRGFVEIARRLTIPYYEEARRYFHAASQDGNLAAYNEVERYTPETLLWILELYGKTHK